MIFEWDKTKETENIEKHGVDFDTACCVFQDPDYLIREDVKHSADEPRYFAIGIVGENILTVRYTLRDTTIRIIGAGYWRKGKEHYEEKYKLK
jgi:uncharacterized DUF497 family protein